MDIFGLNRENSARSSQVSIPDWIIRMQKDYQETRAYRATDLGRLLGDQTVAVQGTTLNRTF